MSALADLDTAVPDWDGLIARMEEHGADEAALIAVRIGREAEKGERLIIALLEQTIVGVTAKLADLYQRLDALEQRVEGMSVVLDHVEAREAIPVDLSM